MHQPVKNIWMATVANNIYALPLRAAFSCGIVTNVGSTENSRPLRLL